MAVLAQFILVCLVTIRREKACVFKFGLSVVVVFLGFSCWCNLLWDWDEGKGASDSVSRKHLTSCGCDCLFSLQSTPELWAEMTLLGEPLGKPPPVSKNYRTDTVVISFSGPVDPWQLLGKLIVSELQSCLLITLYRSDCGVFN